MSAVSISDLRSFVSAGKILWTEHVALRLRERKIKRVDVINCIQVGGIIEQYPTATPFPSCLVVGTSLNGKPLHIVCGLNPGNYCCIITAYYPDSDKWELDNQTRKAGK